MRYFATLCDYSYLPRAIAMRDSLAKHSSEPFIMFALPLDKETADYLWTDPGFESISLSHLEEIQQLAGAKVNRTWQEYCWTLASNLCDYILQHRKLPEITYLDADLFFFSDPKPVFDEIGPHSIAITPHRFTPENRARLEVNGIYNVGWVTFKNTRAGRECAATWARNCREWCYNRRENGKFGDQGYLDRWPEEYPGEVYVIGNAGVNLGPWSLPNYEIGRSPSDTTVDGKPIVCYHLHEFQDNDGLLRLTNHPLRDEDRRFLYDPYVEAYNEAKTKLEAVHI